MKEYDQTKRNIINEGVERGFAYDVANIMHGRIGARNDRAVIASDIVIMGVILRRARERRVCFNYIRCYMVYGVI